MMDKYLGAQAMPRDVEGMRNQLAPPPRAPSVMQSMEKLHAGIERIEQSLSALESHLQAVLLNIPERTNADAKQEGTGIPLVDITDEAVRRVFALAARIDSIGQRAAV